MYIYTCFFLPNQTAGKRDFTAIPGYFTTTLTEDIEVPLLMVALETNC